MSHRPWLGQLNVFELTRCRLAVILALTYVEGTSMKKWLLIMMLVLAGCSENPHNKVIRKGIVDMYGPSATTVDVQGGPFTNSYWVTFKAYPEAPKLTLLAKLNDKGEIEEWEEGPR